MADVIKTLDDLIEFTDTFDIRNTVFYRQVENLIIPATTSYDTYFVGYKDAIETFNTNREQRVKYSYRPNTLSVDVYGTPSLGWLIMKLNSCECPSKFKVRSRIKLIPKENLEEISVNIISKSKNALDKNWAEYLNDLDFVYPYSLRASSVKI